MKLLTLNTHSLIGEDFSERAAIFFAALAKEQPDVVALQEVNQSRGRDPIHGRIPAGFMPCRTDIPLQKDNYALQIAEAMEARGIDYSWTWLPMKIGYGKYDEGLAYFSRRPFAEIRSFPVSRLQDYEDFHTRMALCVRPEGLNTLYCNVHMSWWRDPNEGFAEEWERLLFEIGKEESVCFMGDFNNPAEIRGEGYDLVSRCGFYDAYELAEERRGGPTAQGNIDGWRNREGIKGGIRIDQIRPNRPMKVKEYRTVFDGQDLPVVSDHFGVMITVEEEKERKKT